MNWFRRPKPKTFEERVASRPTTPPKITMPAPRPPGTIRPLTITGKLADLDEAGRNYQDHIDRIVRIHAKQLDDACRIAQELGVGVAVIRDTTHGTQHAAPNRWIPAGHLYQFPDTQSYLTFCKEQP